MASTTYSYEAASELLFAGYYRDGVGQDYANARYYSAVSGGFWSPDPSGISTADPSKPTSWNRTAYVGGDDPVNFVDPGGKDDCPAGGCSDDEGNGSDHDICMFYPYYPGCGATGRPQPTPKLPAGWNTFPGGTGKTAWQYLTSIWTRCLSDFNELQGFDSSRFQDLLNGGMKFLDTRNSAVAGETEDAYAHNSDMRTLASLFKDTGNVAVTLPGSNYVALGPDYFADETQTEQIAIAIHEALHIMFPDLGDLGLAATLEQFGFTEFDHLIWPTSIV